jgi:hypothetical protein
MDVSTPWRRSSTDPAPSARQLLEQSERVREDIVALIGAARLAARSCSALLRSRCERQPYATLAMAAGVGYVLGGGVPNLPLGRMLGLAGRLALERALVRLVRPQSDGGRWPVESAAPPDA